MDAELEEIVARALMRGSRYVKGASSPAELPEKLAELGVLLLEKSKVIRQTDRSMLREDLIELQNKIDDMRKALFANKQLIK